MIFDLFAGPGGWDVGYFNLCLDRGRPDGLEDLVGVEIDKWACATRGVAGLRTIRGDVSAVMPEHVLREPVEGIIASPPCQTFSQAGKRAGLDEMSKVLETLKSGTKHSFSDPRTELVLAPMDWIKALQPDWVCLEQVRTVLPVWESYATALEALGYSTWTGVLNAADFGVPQTRKRAFMVASRLQEVHPPEPTHAKQPELTLDGELLKWVTMAEALGWRPDVEVNTRGNRQTQGGNEFPADQPSWALTEKTRSWRLNTGRAWKKGKGRESAQTRELDEPAPTLSGVRSQWQWEATEEPWGLVERQAHGAKRTLDEPAPTITASADNSNFKWVFERPSTTIVGSFRPEVCAPPTYRTAGMGPRQNQPGAVTITIEEALVLQSFPWNYPIQGPRTAKFSQVGNAVPPVLAQAVLEMVV